VEFLLLLLTSPFFLLPPPRSFHLLLHLLLSPSLVLPPFSLHSPSYKREGKLSTPSHVVPEAEVDGLPVDHDVSRVIVEDGGNVFDGESIRRVDDQQTRLSKKVKRGRSEW